MKERRSDIRMIHDHLRVGLDLLHVAREKLPDVTERPCDTFSRCADCNPVCAATHILASAQHWIEECHQRIHRLMPAEALERLEENWRLEQARFCERSLKPQEDAEENEGSIYPCEKGCAGLCSDPTHRPPKRQRVLNHSIEIVKREERG